MQCTKAPRYFRIWHLMHQKNQAKGRWDRVKFGLDTLLTATHPLKVYEMQRALSINVEDGSVDFEKRSSVPPLEEFLGPLVQINPGDSVSFIHHSVRVSIPVS